MSRDLVTSRSGLVPKHKIASPVAEGEKLMLLPDGVDRTCNLAIPTQGHTCHVYFNTAQEHKQV